MGIVDPKRIGIVFALPEERRGLERVFLDSRAPVWLRGEQMRWHAGTVEVVSVVSGVGPERCSSATEELLREGLDALVCAGFAGGLDPALAVGDVVAASTVLASSGCPGEAVPCSKGLVLAAMPPDPQSYPVRQGRLISHDHVVCKTEEKRSIHETTGAMALDMESYAAGDACRRRRVPFLALRSITDTADHELPDAVASLASCENGFSRFVTAASQPGLWPALIRLRGHARKAADNLGDALGLMILRLGRRSEDSHRRTNI